ncbi:hypothetical protein DFH27DRAFT_608220 [Peziza echinospora]|nr:hypothetical protein DFH27DRAFT_608220 [Peziza echinospora]
MGSVPSMKAVKIVKSPCSNGEGVVKVKNTNRPTEDQLKPGENMVLTQVKSISLNPTDWKHFKYNPAFGATAGCEYAGVIVAVPPDEKKWKVGDRVAGVGHGGNQTNPDLGCFCEYYLQYTYGLIKIPDSWTFDEGATLPMSLHTAGQALYKEHDSLFLPYPETDSDIKVPVLVSGGTTSTGMGAIQLLKLSGQKVITTCSPKNFDLVRSLGADEVFDYNDPDVVSKIKEASDNNLQHCFDCISDEKTLAICRDSMSPGGGNFTVILPIADTSSFPENIKVNRMLVYITLGLDFWFFGQLWKRDDRDVDFTIKWAEIVNRLLGEGKLKPLPVRVLPGGLAGVAKGFEQMIKGEYSAEKLIARVEDTPGL